MHTSSLFSLYLVIVNTLGGLVALVHAQGKAPSASASPLPLPDFARPPAATRPKFRYWLPDASVPATQVEADIAALAAASAGGLEFLPFYNYGLPPPVTDWSTYGFGTPAFRTLFRAALRAADAHGLVFDFALGANQGAGVPAVPETPGLAMELVMGAQTVGPGQKASTSSPPPPEVHFRYEPLQGFINAPELWGANELVAVVAAPVMSRGPREGRGGGEQVVLDHSHTLDLTELARNGTLGTWEPPEVVAGPRFNGSWEVMAFYQRYTNERSCVSTPDASAWIGNGSWMVDHFSAEGAKKVTDFWDEHIFSDHEIKQLIKKTGGYSWEDSMEMMASLWWTRSFLDSFQKARNYSAISWLPVFFQAKNLWNGYSAPYNVSYSFQEYPTDGWKYAEDYRLTLNEGYEDYLRYTQAWAESNGFQHSAQPAYNLPLDMFSTIPLVGAPELESLGFRESINLYRQFTGSAHMGNRNVISTEIGAQRIGAYAQPLPILLNLVQDSFAAGVNTLVIHGFPYGGTYYGTTWPGYTPFQYEFGEMWGPRQPAWPYMNDSMMYMGRNSLVLKTGVAKVDVAFVMWDQPWSGSVVYPGSNLTAAGYTYEYVGNSNLASASAVVQDRILAPDGPGYKALVLYNQTRITPAASTALIEFAKAGLPIFIVGPIPLSGVGTKDQLTVTLNMDSLRNHKFPNVQLLQFGQFTPEALKGVGVLPRATAAAVDGPSNASSQLYTQWRVDAKTNLQLVYILNRGPKTTFTLTFNGTRAQKPYVLDAWTGNQSPLLAFDIVGDAIVTNITLSQQQSATFAFSGSQNDNAIRITSLSPSGAKIWPKSGGSGVEVLLDGTSDTFITLSNGTNLRYTAANDSATSKNTLGPWNLTLECQAAPTQLPTDNVMPKTTKHTIASPLATLVPWTKLPTAQHCSGTGTYRTVVNLPALHMDRAAYTLHFTGRVLHTLRAFVNGAPVDAIDPSAPDDGRDISALLKEGDNEVRVEVSSTLFNAVKEKLNDLKSLGMGPRVSKPYTETKWAEFGLVGEVAIKKWRRVVVL